MLSGMSRTRASSFSVALLIVLILAGLTQEPLLVALAVLVLQALVASAPNPPDERGRAVRGPGRWPALAAGLVATVLTTWPGLLVGSGTMRAGRDSAISNGTVGGILLAAALGVLLSLVAEMFRRDGRPHLVVSIAHSVTLVMFAALAACWIAAAKSTAGAEVVVVAAAGMSAALLVWSLPFSRMMCAAMAVLAGAAGGAWASLLFGGSTSALFGVLIGVMTAIFAVLGQVFGQAWSRGRAHAAQGWGFPGALAVTLPAPVVHVCGQLLGMSML